MNYDRWSSTCNKLLLIANTNNTMTTLTDTTCTPPATPSETHSPLLVVCLVTGLPLSSIMVSALPWSAVTRNTYPLCSQPPRMTPIALSVHSKGVSSCRHSQHSLTPHTAYLPHPSHSLPPSPLTQPTLPHPSHSLPPSPLT